MNKTRILLLILTLFLCSLLGHAQNIPDAPNPPRLVNDYTNTLSSGEKAQLERKLVAFNDSTSTQIAVVLVPSLEGYDISDYAQRLGDKWGVGQKGKRNGAVVLVAIADRKVFISTGYGLEGALPDAYAKRITSTIIAPAFKNGNYFGGLDAGTDAIIKLTKGEYTADSRATQGKGGASGFLFIFVILGVFMMFTLMRSRKNYQHIAGRGDKMGGAGQGGGSVPFWLLMTMLGNSGRGGGGSWGDFRGGGGDFRGGGGFGGFGGGGFGGGGAGSSW